MCYYFNCPFFIRELCGITVFRHYIPFFWEVIYDYYHISFLWVGSFIYPYVRYLQLKLYESIRVIIRHSYWSYLFLLSVSFVSLFTATSFSYRADLEKGIEIIRGNGYSLIDRMPYDVEDDQRIIILTDFNSFLNVFKRLDLEDNLFAISVDHENRVIFTCEL